MKKLSKSKRAYVMKKYPGMIETVEGIEQMERGGPIPPGFEVSYLPLPMNAKELREFRAKLRLSQAQLSRLINTPTKTYQNWEQGLRKPDGLATLLFRLINANPEVIDMLKKLTGTQKGPRRAPRASKA